MFFLWQVWVENRLSEVSVLVLNFSFGAGLAEDSEGIFRPRGQYQCPSSHGGVKGHRCNRRFCRLFRGSLWRPMVAIHEKEKNLVAVPSVCPRAALSLNSTSLWQLRTLLWQGGTLPSLWEGPSVASALPWSQTRLHNIAREIPLPSCHWQGVADLNLQGCRNDRAPNCRVWGSQHSM